MTQLYNLVYYMNLPLLIGAGVALLALWTLLARLATRHVPALWRVVCICLVPVCLFLIYCGTIRGRPAGDYPNFFIPFEVVFRFGLSWQYVREFVLNAVLFAPLGATLTFALPGKRWWLCLPVAAVVSLVVEILQAFVLQVGYFQTDDLLCNVLGCLVGAVPFLLCRLWQKKRGR